MPTTAALRDLAAFGPFFAVDTHVPGSVPHKPWRSMNELVENPDALTDRIEAVRAGLAAASKQSPDAVEFRVAASVTHLGLIARFISPALALAITTGELLMLDLENTRWQPMLGGAFPLSVPLCAHTINHDTRSKPEHIAHYLANHVFNGPVRALVHATRSLSVSPHTLWGNVASAVNTATSMIEARQPSMTHRARAIVASLLNQSPLHNTSIPTTNGTFRRRSCCLIYRVAPVPTAAVCGDCILSSDPSS
jgi:ferric iron reductase protein FhuF